MCTRCGELIIDFTIIIIGKDSVRESFPIYVSGNNTASAFRQSQMALLLL
jgi:hypothetical protein